MYGVKAAVLSGYGQGIELKNVTLLGSNSDKRRSGLETATWDSRNGTNDTKMGLKCKSDREKRKYSSI